MTNYAAVLLARAQALLTATVTTTSAGRTATAGNAARLAAFLTRQAVEELIDQRCAELCAVQRTGGTAKARIAIIKSLDRTPAAVVLIDAWHHLTDFCHQHAYQLSPTTAEVRTHCLAVQDAYFSADKCR